MISSPGPRETARQPQQGFRFHNLSKAMPGRSYSTERDQVPWRKKDNAKHSPVKLLAWVAVLGFVFGLIGIMQLPEDLMRIARNKLHPHAASGDIVFVSIDDRSVREVGRWPWPRRKHAEVIDRLTAAGARRIYIDVMFEAATNPVDDGLLGDAIRRSGRVYLPVRGDFTKVQSNREFTGPLPQIGSHARLGTIAVEYNYQNAVWNLPRAVNLKGRAIPSFASSLANDSTATGPFKIDYSLDPRTIPVISAVDILNGKLPSRGLMGKDVVIGADSPLMGDRFFVPGHGKMAGAYVQIIGAETLKRGRPVELSWILSFGLAVAACALALRAKSWRLQTSSLGGLLVGLTFLPMPLESNLIFVDVAPAMFVVSTVWSIFLWRHYRSDGLINPASGLPSLAALKASRNGKDQALIAARIVNYAEIAATLNPESERVLIDQIVNRLTIGMQDRVIFHGDGGIFAWFEAERLPFGHHIDALHALFRNPVKVEGQPIDLSVSFGVEIGSSRSVANRLGSALVAAEEAAHDGLKWKIHDPEKLNDASWKLSLLSRLDHAIDQGEVWVAYQPKLDLRTRQIIGAEALARWTHPEKGPIAASEFIPAAEQNDRIGKLTDFVLEHAIASAARVNAAGREFHMAVNLSARLLADAEFESRLSEMLLRHLLEPEFLTLELTETSAITSNAALERLRQLRDLGVQISIDDYGTGLSTLDYLKKVPASELKIDQSFIRGLLENRSDRVMVQSTIALAHSLNRTVVAEGVETNELLNALAEMNCDVAQGFIIGRPMSFDSLRRRLTVEKRRSVA